MTELVSLLLVAMFLLLTAFFAGSETGFVSLDIERLVVLARDPKGDAERTLLKIARSPERFLGLTLVGINVSMVIATSLFTEILEISLPRLVAFGVPLMSLFILIFCEMVPKMLFASRPLELSRQALPFITFFDWLFTWPVWAITIFAKGVMGLMGLRAERKKRQVTRDELLIILSSGASSGAIRERPHRMARGIIGLKETNISEIMVPRGRIIGLEVNTPLAGARKVFVESGFSRMPVFEGKIDQIIGVVYFKHLFHKAGAGTSLREIMVPVPYVPEMSDAYSLFRKMKSQNLQVAVVLDEYGSAAGIVTLEDLLEEVVGEIQDELDDTLATIRVHEDGTITVRADMTLADFHRESGLSLPELDGALTLNGFILAGTGRIPQTGETLTIAGWKIDILQSDRKRVVQIRVHAHHD